MVYLDHAATTPIHPQVVEVIQAGLSQVYGNPSSTYKLGREAGHQLRTARIQAADLLGIDPGQVYFTSGATESNNWALKALSQASQGHHIVATGIEHPSVSEVLAYLEGAGVAVTYLRPGPEGLITLADFQAATKPETIGWVAMAVNNELGTLLPFHELGQAAQELGLWFHLDAVQAVGHLDIDWGQVPYTTMSLSGHKLGGPKGIGLLAYRGEDTLPPLLHGGGQEGGRRSGTENVPYIMGLVKALEIAILDQTHHQAHYRALSQALYQGLDQAGINYQINGPQDNKTHHIHNLWLPGLKASQLLIQLDMGQVYISAGSACSAGSLSPSPILKAYYPGQEDRWEESIRISFGPQTTDEEIETLLEALNAIIERKSSNGI